MRGDFVNLNITSIVKVRITPLNRTKSPILGHPGDSPECEDFQQEKKEFPFKNLRR